MKTPSSLKKLMNLNTILTLLSPVKAFSHFSLESNNHERQEKKPKYIQHNEKKRPREFESLESNPKRQKILQPCKHNCKKKCNHRCAYCQQFWDPIRIFGSWPMTHFRLSNPLQIAILEICCCTWEVPLEVVQNLFIICIVKSIDV